MAAFAAQVLAGGASEIGTVLPYAVAAAACILAAAGVLAVLLFKGTARWRRIRGEVGDDTLAMLGRPQPAPWPDGDTVIADGLSAELNEMLKGDGRDD